MNFNKVFLGGNLTRDPQLSYLPSQMAVVEFGIAVNRNWKGKGGEKKSEVCFVDCRAFGKPAETLNKYTGKGDPLFIEGRLDFDSWTAKDGSKRSKHRVTVESFQFLGQGQQKPQRDNPMETTDPVGNKHRTDEANDYDPDNPDGIPF